MRKSFFFLALVFLLLTLSCGGGGGGSSSGGGGGGNDVSGTWTGTGVVNGTSYPTTFIFNQSGNLVSGTWDGYAFTGTVSGSQLSLTLTPFINNGYYMTGSGSLTVVGNSISGTMSMMATKNGFSGTSTGTYTLTRSSAALVAPAGELAPAVVRAVTK
jgi:hypothetical protein